MNSPNPTPPNSRRILHEATGSVGFALDLEHFERNGFPDIADRVAAAVTPAVLRAAADLAATCIECGEIHEYRQVSKADDCCFRGTWASERDGHVYRRRRSEGTTLWLRRIADEIEAEGS